MSDEVYTEQPATVAVRLVDVQVHEPGFRTKGFTVATTMLDHKRYTAAWIGSVYRSRWLVELDIRSIKCSLGMNVIRAKTPEMVRTEFWSCLLAYNLIRANRKYLCHDPSLPSKDKEQRQCKSVTGEDLQAGSERC